MHSAASALSEKVVSTAVGIAYVANTTTAIRIDAKKFFNFAMIIGPQ